jgi:hypothetical protein
MSCDRLPPCEAARNGRLALPFIEAASGLAVLVADAGTSGPWVLWRRAWWSGWRLFIGVSLTSGHSSNDHHNGDGGTDSGSALSNSELGRRGAVENGAKKAIQAGVSGFASLRVVGH